MFACDKVALEFGQQFWRRSDLRFYFSFFLSVVMATRKIMKSKFCSVFFVYFLLHISHCSFVLIFDKDMSVVFEEKILKCFSGLFLSVEMATKIIIQSVFPSVSFGHCDTFDKVSK